MTKFAGLNIKTDLSKFLIDADKTLSHSREVNKKAEKAIQDSNRLISGHSPRSKIVALVSPLPNLNISPLQQYKEKAELIKVKSKTLLTPSSPANPLQKVTQKDWSVKIAEPKNKNPNHHYGKELKDLHDGLHKIEQPWVDGKQVNYIDRLGRHIPFNKDKPPSHDVHTSLSQIISFAIKKLIRHKDNAAHKNLASQVLDVATVHDFSNAKIYQPLLKEPSGNEGDQDDLGRQNTRNEKNKSKDNIAVANIQAQIGKIKSRDAVLQDPDAKLDDVFISAAKEVIEAKKPDAGPFVSKGTCINHHSHPLNNYHLNLILKKGLEWQSKLGKKLGIIMSVIMPIPHRIVVNKVEGFKETNENHQCCGVEGDFHDKTLHDPTPDGPAQLNHDQTPLDKDENSALTHQIGASNDYYTDALTAEVVFTSNDKLMIEAFNEQSAEVQNTYTLAPTGLRMRLGGAPKYIGSDGKQITPTKKDDEAMVLLQAKCLARAIALSKIFAGERDIMVIFGELTGNKPQVKQEMPSENGPKGFREDVRDLQLAIYAGAIAGIQEAIETAINDKKLNPQGLQKEDFKAQVRIVFHNDTEVKENIFVEAPRLTDLERKKIKIEQPTNADAPTSASEEYKRVEKVITNSKDNSPPVEEIKIKIKQPTIGDVFTYASEVNNGVEKFIKDSKDKGLPVECVLQVAHLLGVNTTNYATQRTQETIKFFEQTRDFKNLRVITDTSWLTAAARTANVGMGNFLITNNTDPTIKEIGNLMLEADAISNDGFMFLSEGERYFKKKMDMELNTGAGTVEKKTAFGVGLMRGALEKSSQSYHQQLGLIHKMIDGNQAVALNLLKHIKGNGKDVAEGNFIGMMIRLFNDYNKITMSSQDAVPFVWGMDDLTHAAENSGVEKFKLYRDQFICGALMEMLIDNLPHGEDKKMLSDILRQMRMGADRDQEFWFPNGIDSDKENEDEDLGTHPNESGKKVISTENIHHEKSPVLPFTSQNDNNIRAANELVEPGRVDIQTPKNEPFERYFPPSKFDPPFTPGENVFYFALERWTKAGDRSELRVEANNRIDNVWWNDNRKFELDLAGLNLKSIPNCIIGINNLQSLNLVGNHIKQLPDLRTMASLKKIYVSPEVLANLSRTHLLLPPNCELVTFDQTSQSPAQSSHNTKLDLNAGRQGIFAGFKKNEFLKNISHEEADAILRQHGNAFDRGSESIRRGLTSVWRGMGFKKQ